MNYKQALRRCALVGSVCALVLALSNCSDDSQPVAATPHGQGGEAVSGAGAAGDAGMSSVSVCSVPTHNNVCDPVTGAACDLEAGETCDESESFGGFKCFPGPNPQRIGDDCDTESLFCGPGLRCVFDAQPKCYRYCCENSDCPSGSCSVGLLDTLSLGLCLDEFGTPAAAGAAGAESFAGASGTEASAGSGGTSGERG